MPIATKKRTKRIELAEWIEANRPPTVGHAGANPAVIGEAELARIREALAPISENYLRTLLRESGVALSAMVAGVRQGDLDELEVSLNALAEEYVRGDPARRTQIRRIVIVAKDHARWASRQAGIHAEKQSQAEKRPPASDHRQKDEMILWMLTWLENPPLFAQWAGLRRAALKNSGSAFDS